MAQILTVVLDSSKSRLAPPLFLKFTMAQAVKLDGPYRRIGKTIK